MTTRNGLWPDGLWAACPASCPGHGKVWAEGGEGVVVLGVVVLGVVVS